MKLETLAIGLVAAIPLATAYNGDMTFYTPGMGSCGQVSSDGAGVVALSNEMMKTDGNPNQNPKCGSKIGIFNPANGAYTEATVVDTCGGCKEFDIDVDESTFSKLASPDLGRVTIDWGGDAVGG